MVQDDDCRLSSRKNLLTFHEHNIGKCYRTLYNAITEENCIIFFQMKTCPFTIPVYRIWETVVPELVKHSNLNIIEINNYALMYLKRNENWLFQKLNSIYPDEENEPKVYFPTILFYKYGVQYRFENIEELREINKDNAYERILSFALLYLYRKDIRVEEDDRNAVKKQRQKTSLNSISYRGGHLDSKQTTKKGGKITNSKRRKTLQQQITEAFKNKLQLNKNT